MQNVQGAQAPDARGRPTPQTRGEPGATAAIVDRVVQSCYIGASHDESEDPYIYLGEKNKWDQTPRDIKGTNRD